MSTTTSSVESVKSGLDRMKTFKMSELTFHLDFEGKEKYLPLLKQKRFNVNMCDKDCANVIVGKALEKEVGQKGIKKGKVFERFVIDEATLKDLLCGDINYRSSNYGKFKSNVVVFVPKELAISNGWDRTKRVWYTKDTVPTKYVYE